VYCVSKFLDETDRYTSGDKTPFIFAHEFFDALPIHAFQSVAPSTGSQPQQIMTPTGPTELKQPAKHSETPQWRELLVALNTKAVVENIKDEPEFQLTLAKASTPSSLVIPEISDRYKALKSQPGATVEISPESRIYVADFARRIGGSSADSKIRSSTTRASSASTSKKQPSGAALILDYGPSSSIPINSLRGIRQHAKLSPFAFPGQVDVSADVDFTALAEAALEASEGVEVHGPVEQGDYLHSLGIVERATQLLKEVKDEEQRKTIESGWRRLVDKGPGGMGKLYRALAIVPENGGRRRPLGFGGDVVV
jgi:NADH dehydrogenase [ubiquinone] 1 alpha subcomplex assembly factor 7